MKVAVSGGGGGRRRAMAPINSGHNAIADGLAFGLQWARHALNGFNG